MRQDRLSERRKAMEFGSGCSKLPSSGVQAVMRLLEVMRRCGRGWETVEEVRDQLPAAMATNSEVVNSRVKQDGMEEMMRFGDPEPAPADGVRSVPSRATSPFLVSEAGWKESRKATKQCPTATTCT